MARGDHYNSPRASRQRKHLAPHQPDHMAQRKAVPKETSTPADESRSEPLPDGMQLSPLLDWGIEDLRPPLDALDSITLP